MLTKSVTLSNPIYEILQQTTGDTDINSALSKILKDFFRLKTGALREQIAAYEKKIRHVIFGIRKSLQRRQDRRPELL